VAETRRTIKRSAKTGKISRKDARTAVREVSGRRVHGRGADPSPHGSGGSERSK
jgi:hypothetical protein